MNNTKYILHGIILTTISAMFAVFGVVTAISQNLVAGIFIVIASSLFWGYACLLSGIVESKLKRQHS